MQNKAMLWTGRVLSVLITIPYIFGAIFGMTGNPQAVQGMAHFGVAPTLLVPLGYLQLILVILYLLPWTTVLGAILLCTYMGGAVFARLRVGENFSADIIIGILIWLGVYLREPKLRQIVPWRKIE